MLFRRAAALAVGLLALLLCAPANAAEFGFKELATQSWHTAGLRHRGRAVRSRSR